MEYKGIGQAPPRPNRLSSLPSSASSLKGIQNSGEVSLNRMRLLDRDIEAETRDHSEESVRAASRPSIWSASSLISASTINLTNSCSLTLGRHPNFLSALLASPCRSSTSLGRKYLGSI